MAPVRVLHIVTYMGLGGIETMLMNYYREIDRSKVQFDFLVHRDFEAAYDAEIQALGGRIYRLPKLNPFHPGYRSALARFFREHREYTIVHAHLDCMAGIPLKAAAKQGVPVRIAHAHNSGQTRDFKYPIKLFYKRLIPKYATHLFACSHSAGQWMFPKCSYQLIPNAIHTAQFSDPGISPVCEQLSIPEGSFVVGHIGRFCPQKNHRQLLEIFNTLHQHKPDSMLLLIGDGPGLEDIKRCAKKLNLLSNVIFAGQRTDIPSLLRSMDVFVLPSRHEGFPVCVLEAQAAGLPCIISDTVSSECAVTPLVRQLPLNASAETWVQAVMEASEHPALDVTRQIMDAGFDVVANAGQLQKLYLSWEEK